MDRLARGEYLNPQTFQITHVMTTSEAAQISFSNGLSKQANREYVPVVFGKVESPVAIKEASILASGLVQRC